MICPSCREGTRNPRGKQPERCIDQSCPVDRIERNNRGDAWAWDHTGRLLYKPNHHPLPVDTEPGRAVPHAGDDTPLPDYSTNDAMLARMFGTTGMSVRTKEARK